MKADAHGLPKPPGQRGCQGVDASHLGTSAQEQTTTCPGTSVQFQALHSLGCLLFSGRVCSSPPVSPWKPSRRLSTLLPRPCQMLAFPGSGGHELADIFTCHVLFNTQHWPLRYCYTCSTERKLRPRESLPVFRKPFPILADWWDAPPYTPQAFLSCPLDRVPLHYTRPWRALPGAGHTTGPPLSHCCVNQLPCQVSQLTTDKDVIPGPPLFAPSQWQPVKAANDALEKERKGKTPHTQEGTSLIMKTNKMRNCFLKVMIRKYKHAVSELKLLAAQEARTAHTRGQPVSPRASGGSRFDPSCPCQHPQGLRLCTTRWRNKPKSRSEPLVLVRPCAVCLTCPWMFCFIPRCLSPAQSCTWTMDNKLILRLHSARDTEGQFCGERPRLRMAKVKDYWFPEREQDRCGFVCDFICVSFSKAIWLRSCKKKKALVSPPIHFF